jgi:hypothetical protein
VWEKSSQFERNIENCSCQNKSVWYYDGESTKGDHMAHLKYYAEENKRWEALNGKISSGAAGGLGEDECVVGAKRLVTHFASSSVGKELWVGLTSGRNYSKARAYEIVLNRDHLSWLLVIHEAAHVVVKYLLRVGKARIGENHHGRRHAKIVDRMCNYVIKMGWHTGTLAEGLAYREYHQEERESAAARPPSTDDKIESRKEQVKRLERKIKMLTTRLKSAKRSLGALERSRAKKVVEQCSKKTEEFTCQTNFV